MAQSFISELGDKMGVQGVSNTDGAHVKTISSGYYKRTENGAVTNELIQDALDGKAASNHSHGNITSDGKMDNPDNITCPLVVADDGTICRAYFGSRPNTVAEGNHTHALTFSTTTGTPDYVVKAGDIVSLSAGGTTKKVQFAPDYVNTLEDPFIPPDVAGSMWRNANTGDIWIAKGASSVSDWILVHNRIHDLIVQRQSVVIGGQGASSPILCDKQNYTTSVGGVITFARVDPYELAKWKNRGDVIQVGGEVDYDPWGDGYPMRITEYQAVKDANDKWYCTNLNLRGYKYTSTTEGSYWGNLNHDDTTGKDFIEFPGW